MEEENLTQDQEQKKLKTQIEKQNKLNAEKSRIPYAERLVEELK